MSNMSYCRFENTRNDMRDCMDAIRNYAEASDRELEYAKYMFKSIGEFMIDQGIINDYNEEAIDSMLEEMNA